MGLCYGAPGDGGLSRPAACGIFVPRQGIERGSLALEGGFLSTEPSGKSLFGKYLYLLPSHSFVPEM